MAEAAGERSVSKAHHKSHRWLQLALGVLCMTMVANLQYGWTLFVDPMQAKFGWDRAAIQVAFTIFVVAETWLTPFEGYLEDLFGPRPLLLVGGLLVGFGTRIANGCTSGHGVCGLARLSPRSLAATLTFMAAGFVTVFVVRHVFFGGAS